MSAVWVVGLLVLLAMLVLPAREGVPGPQVDRDDAGERARSGSPSGRPDRGVPPEAVEASTGEVCEAARLLAAALRAGGGVVEAIEVVAAHSPEPVARTLVRVAAAQRWGRSPQGAWAGAGGRWAPVARALVAAEEAGLSPARALEAAAERLERERRTRVTRELRRLEVLVVVPLGLAFLPGFLLTTVVPVVVTLARSALR